MRSRLRVSGPAIADLQHIRNWLSDNASSAIAADQLERIAKAFRKLRDFPGLGEGASDQLRRKSVARSNYILVYKVTRAEVVVLRVRHVRENWRDE